VSEATDLLANIDRTLTSIKGLLGTLVLRSTPASEKKIAPDSDLDGKYGDPEVKFMPRDWEGDDYSDMKLSTMPPELLDMVADLYDYRAERAEEEGKTTVKGRPVAPLNRADAARARGWAARKRAGSGGEQVPSEPAAPATAVPDDDDIPF
jgi:hypothetical protein